MTRWYGVRSGARENPTWCIVQVDSRTYGLGQCTRRRGHGPDGLYCKRHARMLEQGKRLTVPKDE